MAITFQLPYVVPPPTTPGIGVKNPQFIDDGNWNELLGDGAPSVKWPFKDQGDNSSWEISIRCLQDARAYLVIPAMTICAVPTYLQGEVGATQGFVIDPGDPQDAGNGLVSFTVVLACIPIVRLIGGSIVHNFQYPDSSIPGSPIIRQLQINVSCFTLWEYNVTPYKAFTAPVYFIGIGNVISSMGIFQQVTFTLNSRNQGPAGQPAGQFSSIPNNPIPAGTIIVGQDSTCDIYKSGIYYRKTQFIVWPSTSEVDSG